jgi:hypothetical protein
MIGRRSLPFSIEKDAGKRFSERLESLLAFDEIRVMKLLEIFQYSTLYFISGFFLGSFLETLFPKFDEEKEVNTVIFEVLGQLLTFALMIFYVRKLVKLVPFMFMLNWDINGDGKIGKFRPYMTTEYEGELTIGIVVIASQVNLLKKIELLSREYERRIMGAEKRRAPRFFKD